MQSERSTNAFRTLDARVLDGSARGSASASERSPRDRDALTGLPTWAWFDQQLAEWFGEARQGKTALTLILADIDGLDAINKIRGEAAGDEAISAVAACLRRRLRPRDLVARHSGAVFAVMLTRAPASAARLVAERLRASVAADTAPRVTVSIGCVTFERGGFASRQQVLDAAARAMAAAKRDGRDRVVSFQEGVAAGVVAGVATGDASGVGRDGREMMSAGSARDSVGDPLDRSPPPV